MTKETADQNKMEQGDASFGQQELPPPPPREIFERKVPGIGNGELIRAFYAEQQKPKDGPTLNDAFTRTSPNLYHHFNNHKRGVLSDVGQPVDINNAETFEQQQQQNTARQKEEADKKTELRRFESFLREIQDQSNEETDEILKEIQEAKCSLRTLSWLLAIVGIFVLAVCIFLVFVYMRLIASGSKEIVRHDPEALGQLARSETLYK